MKLDPLLTLYTKINSAWAKNLSVSVKAITLLENTDKNLCDLGVSNGFLDMTPKAHTIKETSLNFTNKMWQDFIVYEGIDKS